ncbi:MAG: nitroreductase family deazaflavin-dependent oxidoreductase [Ilumatobacteraceae bacterium]
MDLRHALKDVFLKGANLIHRTVLGVSGGRLGRRIGSMPVVELHTTGRTSGKPRSTMLTAPVLEDDRIVLVASKGGDDRDPDWYRNLVADPDVELTVDGTRRPWRARTASAEEKFELWESIVAAYAGYAGYQRRTERNIPVVICEPQ